MNVRIMNLVCSGLKLGLIVLWPALITAVLSLAASPAPAADADMYRWSADDPSVRRDGLEPVSLQGRPAVQFRSANKTPLDLTSQYAWRTLSGPSTFRLVFQVPHPPRSKVPFVSKWRMTNGGRSWELGILPDGCPYFDVSASGNWDGDGRELVGLCRVRPAEPCCLAAVFEPGRRMALFVNGHECGALTAHVPRQLHANTTPVWLGGQSLGQRWADVAIADFLVDRRAWSGAEIEHWAKSLGLTRPLDGIESPVHEGRMDLGLVRKQVMDYCRSLQVPAQPYGAFRKRALPDGPVTLYASCDVAWTRACMGEDLRTSLTRRERGQWIEHINSFARPDGTYENPNHGEHHRNGMVIGALAVLGGRQLRAVCLYDDFDDVTEVEPWLEQIQWDRQWGASHLFWGGMHCFSLSSRCTPAWRERVFQWLDQNLDPQTGWWRKGVPQAGRHIEVLGGAAHIWPIYQHHQHRFPYPQQIIDSILAMQQPDGSWLGFSNYMELDALYGLAYMRSLAPEYRATDVAAAARLHGRLVQDHYARYMLTCPDTHILLSVVGTLALLQELDPDHFQDSVRWSDIFSDKKFYETSRVEWRSGVAPIPEY